MAAVKDFTGKQVAMLVFVIVAAIAFVETSQPIWTGGFWREFLPKLIVYVAVSEFAVIALGAWVSRSDHRPDI